LHGGQIFGKALEDLQNRVLVVQKHIAPHDRIGCGDAREIAETGRGKFDDLALQILFHIGRRTDNRIGDKVRQVRGDAKDKVVMARAHNLDIGAKRLP